VKHFQISMHVDVTLSTAEIWPDGNAPAEPTEEDVRQLIERSGGPATVLRTWSLDADLVTTVRGRQ
jgi:hypothetical protein